MKQKQSERHTEQEHPVTCNCTRNNRRRLQPATTHPTLTKRMFVRHKSQVTRHTSEGTSHVTWQQDSLHLMAHEVCQEGNFEARDIIGERGGDGRLLAAKTR